MRPPLAKLPHRWVGGRSWLFARRVAARGGPVHSRRAPLGRGQGL